MVRISSNSVCRPQWHLQWWDRKDAFVIRMSVVLSVRSSDRFNGRWPCIPNARTDTQFFRYFFPSRATPFACGLQATRPTHTLTVSLHDACHIVLMALLTNAKAIGRAHQRQTKSVFSKRIWPNRFRFGESSRLLSESRAEFVLGSETTALRFFIC